MTHITPPFDTCTARDNGWESPVPAVLRPSRAPSFPAALVAVRAALVAAAAVRAAGASRSGYFAAAAAA